jgi:hypothetical protein
VTELVRLRADDVVVLIDLQRHERWIVEAGRRVAGVAGKRRDASTRRLDALEAVWTRSGALAE